MDKPGTPARSNKGGQLRGAERVAAVKTMNASKRTLTPARAQQGIKKRLAIKNKNARANIRGNTAAGASYPTKPTSKTGSSGPLATRMPFDVAGDVIKNVFSALMPQDRLMKDGVTDPLRLGLSGKNPYGK